MSKRWRYKWVDQNIIEITDTKRDTLFYLNGDVNVLERYDSLPDTDANLYFAGFLAGIEWCDGQLKHCRHNFVLRDYRA